MVIKPLLVRGGEGELGSEHPERTTSHRQCTDTLFTINYVKTEASTLLDARDSNSVNDKPNDQMPIA